MRITKSQLRKLIRERFSSDDFRDVYHTAQMAHMGQKRRSGEDYFSHPSEVRNIVRKLYPQDKVSQLAALLHDSIEDAPGSTVSSPEEMEEFIRGSIGDPAAGEEIVRVVNALTHEKGGDYHSYVVSLIGDEPALRVKLADMVHNLSSSPSEKQRVKYQGALNALAIAAGGIPAGISGAHWDKLTKLSEGRQMRVTKKQLRRIIREEVILLEGMGTSPVPQKGQWFRLKPKGNRDWYSWAQLDSVEEALGRTTFWTRSGHNLSLSPGDEYQIFANTYEPNYRDEASLDTHIW